MDPSDARIAEVIRKTWGFGTLRPLQAAAIRAGVDGVDCLTVLPTGGGKSLCYQVPPLVTGRPTVVISPLIALMRDQVSGLSLHGYPAAALHSAMEADEARDIVRRLVRGGEDAPRLLLVSPERAITDGFRVMLARLADAGRLGAIAVDEAHCISQWGHDFRPEYRRLVELREVVPGVAMQAFTATATPRVRRDIAEQLCLRAADGAGEPLTLVGTFDRPNLTYRVRPRRALADQVASAIRDMHARGDGGAIVYCISRKDTEQIAEDLRGRGIDAEAYHARLDPAMRHDVERRFLDESLDVVVATVAFGMGIDRSNVRLVAHAALPKSIEAYQQEAGRAGRDGLPAECLLLTGTSDAARWERLITDGGGAAGGSLTPEQEAQIELLRQMQRLAASGLCRHRLLSEHFGQAYTPPDGHSCGACDVCLGETAIEEDAGRIGRILLSAVARLGQRFGAGHVADVVRGADTEKVRERGHGSLSVHGLLRDRSRPEVMSFIDQLIAAGALEHGEHRELRFGARGLPMMKGEEPISLARPAVREPPATRRAPASGGDGEALTGEERELFERLRSLRRRIASELEVPPYVVFSDATLRDLARARPDTPEAMLAVRGVGRRKLEDFGAAFLEEIGGL